jgi:hypothetical protein
LIAAYRTLEPSAATNPPVIFGEGKGPIVLPSISPR